MLKFKTLLLTLVCVACLPLLSAGQAACELGQADAILDANNVRARMYNDGVLFWKSNYPEASIPALYEIPKSGGKHAIFNASMWLGGKVNGELRGAGNLSYGVGPYEYWPGPVIAVSQGQDCAQYDRIYKISRTDLTMLDQGKLPSADVAEWPWQFGAPVVDGDGIPGNYDLSTGDRPELLGDQSLFWIMNDIGNIHETTESEPLGVEVHVTAFSTTNRSRLHFPNTTYYRYRIINQSQESITEAYFGLYMDVDLGNFDDDYLGSDSTLNLAYSYNADNDDDEDRGGYGAAPPAVGFNILGSPMADSDGLDNNENGLIDETGEMLGMTSFMSLGNSSPALRPRSQGLLMDQYNWAQARMNDGQRVTVGGYGSGFSDTPTSFMFPGTPPAFWSEYDIDGDGSAAHQVDRRSVLGVGPFDLGPGDETEVFFSIITSFGNDNLDSVTRLKIAATWDTGLTPQDVPRGASYGTSTEEEQLPQAVTLMPNYPNPFSSSTRIEFMLQEPGHVTLDVLDMLGRNVSTIVDRSFAPGRHEVVFSAAGLPDGVYLYRLTAGSKQESRVMTVLK